MYKANASATLLLRHSETVLTLHQPRQAIESTCSGLRIDGTFKCFGDGYVAMFGPSLFLVEEANAGLAVTKCLLAETNEARVVSIAEALANDSVFDAISKSIPLGNW
jgi:hypothetical protein